MPRISGLRRLKLFKIDGSQIRDLPGDVFRNLPELKFLHIANSNLKKIDSGVLESLNSLQMANFTNNQISWIHSRAFRYMKSLTELSFSGNRIKDSVTVGRAVQAVKGLRSLDVSHNQVRALGLNSTFFGHPEKT